MERQRMVYAQDGTADGTADGRAEGTVEGLLEGLADGIEDGRTEGLLEGRAEGLADGFEEGLTDGLLDVLIVPHTSFWHLLRLFPMIFSGKHVHSKLLIYKKAAQLSVEAAPQMLNIDGEIKLYAPFEVKVLPKQLEMIV